MLAFQPWLIGVCLIGLFGTGNVEEKDDSEAKFDESILKEHRVVADSAGLLGFLRKRTLDEAWIRRVEQLIKELGNERFPVRERATRELIGLGVPTIAYLERATSHSDQEIADRAVRCLQQIRSQNDSSLAVAVLHVVERKRLRESALPILEFIPFADDRYVEDEALRVLSTVAITDGKPNVDLLPLTKEPRAVRRSAAGYLLGRSSDIEHRKLACSLLDDRDVWVQFRTAQGLLAAKDKRAVPVLIALLPTKVDDVAWRAEVLLRGIAQDLSPVLANDEGAQAHKEYCKSWETWWKKHEREIDLAKLPAEPAMLGLTVGIEFNTNLVWECSLDGKRRWSIGGLGGPMDAQILPGQRVLIAEQTANRVTERDIQGKVYWEKTLPEPPLNVRRLANGNTFIGTRQNVMEVRRDGTEVFKHLLSQEYLHAVRRLPDGSFLGISNTGKIVEMDSTGKKTKTIQIPNEGSWGDVDRLPGGNYVITNYSSGVVREVDAKGEKKRQIEFKDACGFQLLANGHFLVSGAGRAALTDWTGKVHWETKSEGYVRRIHRR